jgi:hypothetical protein
VSAKFYFPTGTVSKSDAGKVTVNWAAKSYTYSGSIAVSSYGSAGGSSGLSMLEAGGFFLTSDWRLMAGAILVLLGLMLEVSRRW